MRYSSSPFELIALSSAYLASSGGASAVTVDASSANTDSTARALYGAISCPSVENRRRVRGHDQSCTFAPRSSSRWLPAW